MMNRLAGKVTQAVRDPEVIQVGVEAVARKSPTRWGALLVIFMRIVAALWIFQGLLQWRVILAPEDLALDAMPLPLAAAVAFFAVSDLLAAVGLWLASPWGGVLWLFSASANIIIALFMPDFHTGGGLMLGTDFVLIISYFVLTWFAAQERDY